jgi:hypothetical protein
MRTTRRTTASLATVLSAAALGAPATALAAGDGQASGTPVPQPAPTWPLDPQVIPRLHEVTADSVGSFDWDSAGIGAATILGAIAMGTAGVAVVRRRRVTRVSLPDHCRPTP